MLSQVTTGQSMAGGEHLAAAFWWVDKTGYTFPASKAMRQFQQTIRNSFEMHLTLNNNTEYSKQFVSSQHKVWIFCLQEKAMDIIQEKPCTHLRIYSIEFKIFMFVFFFLNHLERLKICVSSAQAFTRHVESVTTQGTLMRLWKMFWWAFGLIFVISCPPWHARHPWQEFSPQTSVFWRFQKARLEGMDRESQVPF